MPEAILRVGAVDGTALIFPFPSCFHRAKRKREGTTATAWEVFFAPHNQQPKVTVGGHESPGNHVFVEELVRRSSDWTK